MQHPRVFAGALALSAFGLAAISSWEEGPKGTPKVYLDIAKVPTVCMGTTEGLSAADVGRVFSKELCAARNRKALAETERAVSTAVTVPVTQGQYDALVSLTYNIGSGAFRRSTLVKKLNAGDCLGASKEFLRWDKVGSKRIRGLSLRRAQESRTFITGCS